MKTKIALAIFIAVLVIEAKIPSLRAQQRTLTDEEFQALISKEEIDVSELVGLSLTKEQYKILYDKMEADRAKQRAKDAIEERDRKQLLESLAEEREVEHRKIRKAYVDSHPKRPKKILDAVIEGKRVVIGMTPEEVKLILKIDPDRSDSFSNTHGVSEDWTYNSYDEDTGDLIVYLVHFRNMKVTGTSTSRIKK